MLTEVRYDGVPIAIVYYSSCLVLQSFILFLSISASVFGTECWQNGRLRCSRFSNSLNLLAYEHPLQIILLQHDYIVDLSISSGSGNKQIGQSPRWLLSGWLNKISSRNSAARSLHIASCSCRCSSLHSSLQYRARSQASHSFNLMSSNSAMPHEAQHDDNIINSTNETVN